MDQVALPPLQLCTLATEPSGSSVIVQVLPESAPKLTVVVALSVRGRVIEPVAPVQCAVALKLAGVGALVVLTTVLETATQPVGTPHEIQLVIVTRVVSLAAMVPVVGGSCTQ